jgi:RHS repeat-associated protein
LASTVGVKNPYRYRGYWCDNENGWYYLRNRYYTPGLGRFLNSDDIIKDNTFGYCYNNPVNITDSTGRDPEFDPFETVVAGLIVADFCVFPFSSESRLDKGKMSLNAQYILNFLRRKGWSKNAVCGMLGNAEVESTINPGAWQGYKKEKNANKKGGFGLLQWTPSTKLTDWAKKNKLDPHRLDTQLERILYEVKNPSLQWGFNKTGKEMAKNAGYPILTFSQYTCSKESAETLAMVFELGYEKPKSIFGKDGHVNSTRSNKAKYWYQHLK